MIVGAGKSSFCSRALVFASAMETCGDSLTCVSKMEVVSISLRFWYLVVYRGAISDLQALLLIGPN